MPRWPIAAWQDMCVHSRTRHSILRQPLSHTLICHMHLLLGCQRSSMITRLQLCIIVAQVAAIHVSSAAAADQLRSRAISLSPASMITENTYQ